MQSTAQSASGSEITGSRTISDNVRFVQYRVSSSVGAVGVNMVLIKLDAIRNGRLSIEPAMPSDTMGRTASPESIARRVGAIAAINGPYFASAGGYTYPLGFTVINGRLTQLGNLTRPITGFDPKGEFAIEVAHPQVFLMSDKSFEPVWLWNINTPAGSDAVTMYDNRWSGQVGSQGGTAVAVAPLGSASAGDNQQIVINVDNFSGREWDGEVVEVIENSDLKIPDGGYVLVFRGKAKSNISRYPLGAKTVVYTYELPSRFQTMRWLTTLGPWFLSNGWSRDFSGETSYGGNITGRATRSIIGTTWNDEFFMAVTSGAGLNVVETGNVLMECNVREAIMCDSGSSAGLWADGLGVKGSARHVPMAFVVRKLEEPLSDPPPLRLWSGSLHRH